MLRLMKLLALACALIIVGGLLSASLAAQKGSETKGRHFFRDTCKQCHAKGAAGGEVTPLNKTMAQWRAYFAAGTHNHGKDGQHSMLHRAIDLNTFLPRGVPVVYRGKNINVVSFNGK